MEFQFFEPWHGFLPRTGGHVVAFMGGGGKSTLLTRCARVLAAEGTPSVVAATVPGGPPGDGPLVRHAEILAAGPEGPAGESIIRLDTDDDPLPPDEVDLLGSLLPGHVALVEIDSADGRPLRMPDAAEPRWPLRTSLAVVVMGVGAVGSPAGEVVAGFREGALGDADLATWTTWEWDHSLELLAGPGGYLDQVPPDVPTVLALTGLDLQPDSVGLFDFVGRAMAHPRLPIVLFGSLAGDDPGLKAVCREDVEEAEPPGLAER